MRAIVAGTILLAASNLTAAEQSRSLPDRPPDVFRGHNKDASEYIRGFCQPAKDGKIACDLTTIRFSPPDTKHADAGEQEIIAEARKDPEKAKREAKQWAKETRDQAKDVPMGPKTKQGLDALLQALDSGDIDRMAHVLTEPERQTCHVHTSTYPLKFHRIGVRKWQSDPIPNPVCRAPEVWKLSSDDGWRWNVRVRTGPAKEKSEWCAALAKREVTVWNWTGRSTYELPCHFIEYE
jgi:hypothetical protein